MALILDPNDEQLGVDIGVLSDLAAVWGVARGKVNLGYALARRFNTPRGAIPYFPNYGKYLPALVEKSLRQGSLAIEAGEIIAEAEKDPRVQSADVDLVFSFEARRLTIKIMLETADGPFDLVLAATSLTVELLRVDGVVIPAAAVPPLDIVVVAGERGPKGDTGATGSSGGGGSGDNDVEEGTDAQLGDDSGAEVVVWEEPIDFDQLDSDITVAFVTRVLSDAGTGTFRVRIGGTSGVANGTIVNQVTTVSPTFEDKDDSDDIVNPTGVLPVKVTILSSANGVFARLDGLTVTIRTTP